MRGRLRSGAISLACCTALAAAAGCSAAQPVATFIDKGVPAGSFQLVGFNSCADALNGLRAAAKAMVGPYGLGADMWAADEAGDRNQAGADGAAPPMAAEPGAARGGSSVGAAPEPNYSSTNTHEAGVDEPDLVKTDGRRILTISGGVLFVVDAATRSMAGFVELGDLDDPNDLVRYTPADLLLAGDHALVLLRERPVGLRGGPVVMDPGPADAPRVQPTRPDVALVAGPRLLLVDLAGQPEVLASYRIDGGLVDARQVGATARVVVRSEPRLVFPHVERATDAERIENNRRIIDQASLDEWLPRIETTTGADTQRARVNCEAIVRPASYTGTSLLTVLTFDLRADALGHGHPLTVVADGDTVYGNGPSLYVASDQRWRVMSRLGGDVAELREQARTEIYKFDTAAGQPPRFAAGGSVPGYLINQYAMSEWDGKLRVATTTEPAWAAPGQRSTSHSGVYVLGQSGKRLRELGHVDGLGKGERIYAVRFIGPLGYVVTFRQTDPLYTVDLGDPARPTVRGELKITGYSAYLHPVGADKLIGIGQEATGRGQVTGTQVSLFSVADPGQPRRLARYHLAGSHSEAEFDPHAFLYWPETGLLVVPLQLTGAVAVPGGTGIGGVAPPEVQRLVPAVGALVLRVGANRIDEIGFITHPGSFQQGGYPAGIRRSLVIDQTLWTMSDAGLMASDVDTLERLAWIRLT